MDTSLAYLRESLSNHLNRSTGQEVYKKLQTNHYKNEEEFVRDLAEEEVAFLNKILRDEIRYAEEEQDQKRVMELNEVYELLI
ncbi:sigma-G-dependent sporulation-specific acid-soluble spore protein CsgA [Heyndrickxia sp. NPDC080065]|uniref:sigma-G-dependent sporulation-specific acid-soluble spore protein CsgA n=1 Tax=Heyndrickxia sp. NPDC080065 TaxID=3390568 RepID=UPI003CFDC366